MYIYIEREGERERESERERERTNNNENKHTYKARKCAMGARESRERVGRQIQHPPNSPRARA